MGREPESQFREQASEAALHLKTVPPAWSWARVYLAVVSRFNRSFLLSSDFTNRRASALARLAAYGLALVFLVSLVAVFLPPPFLNPQRLSNALVELVERSTLPLVASALLFWGFSGRARPALWECRAVRVLRPLLLLVALLYLLTTISLGLIGQRLEVEGLAAADLQLRGSQAELQRARSLVGEIPDESTLKAWLGSQPALRQALDQQTGNDQVPDDAEDIRARINRLLAISEANLQRDAVRAKAEISARVWGRIIRAGLTSLIYAIYFGLVYLLWPRSLLKTVQRAWKQRNKAVEAAL